VRRGLGTTAWVVTLGGTGLVAYLLVAWDDARTREEWKRSVALEQAKVQAAAQQPATATPPATPSVAYVLPPLAPVTEAAPPAVQAPAGLPQAPPVPGAVAAAPPPAVAAPPAAPDPVANPPAPLDPSPPAPPAKPPLALALPTEPPPALPYEEPDVAPVAPRMEQVPLEPVAPPAIRRPLAPERLEGPTVAIVIDDMGYSDQAVRRLIAAQKPLTLAFLPFSASVQGPARSAVAAGLEVIVHLPMEPVGHENPGPDAIRVGMSGAAIRERVDAALAAVPGAVGLNNHMGSKATADPATIRPVMAELASRGLYFLDSRTTGRSHAQAAALVAGVPAIGRDVFLDNDPSPAAVTRQLQVLERRARSHGYAVAIGHPHAGTLQALLQWLPQAEARGIRLTTLSHLVALDTCRQRDAELAFDCAGQANEATMARALGN
jgi:polysaccharide deacetylase 2 family uncharacterized protein YibQ